MMKKADRGIHETKTPPGRPIRHVMGPIILLSLFAVLAFSCGSGGDGGGGVPIAHLTLSPAIQYATDNVRGANIATGDLNGDGLMDVAITGERDGGQHILVFHQNSKGAFDPAVDIPVQDITLKGLAIGDVDNDGKNELVVSGISRTATAGSLGRMVVYHQNATNGTLEPSPEVIVSSMEVGDLCVADLNSDGRKDIAVLGSSAPATKGNISIFYQKNDGTLDQEYVYKESFVRVTGNLRAADMNSDGRNDLVFQSGDSEVSVVRQLAGGTLSATPDPYTVTTDNSLFTGVFAVGDANGDGKNDVVAVSSGTTNYFHIFLQNGTGGLDPPAPIQLQNGPPDGIELADMNGDGLNDVVGVLANPEAPSIGDVLVYYQGADHGFSASGYKSYIFRASSSAGDNAARLSLATGDVTGDGLRDVLVTGMKDGLYVLPGLKQQTTSYSISGKVTSAGAPLSGVTLTLSGTPGKTTTTNVGGDYTFTVGGNGNYTVTPSKAGYTFTPANRSVTVNGTDISAQDFTGTTYSISGKVTAGGAPLSGVTLLLGGTSSKSATTNGAGDFTFDVVGNGSYTVTPSKAGYTFTPVNAAVTVNGADVTGQDFTGTTYSISGRVRDAGGAALSGVTLSLSGAVSKTTTTNASGDYTFTIVGNGSYTVTPSKTGYTFTPVNRSVAVNGANVTGQDFTGTTYSISGRVTAAGIPLSGVSMSLSGAVSKTTTTDTNGDYTFTIVGNGSYTVTPSRTGYTFSPVNRSVTVNGANVTVPEFTGTTYSISGKVTVGGAPLSGVTMSLSGAVSRTITTDANGDYTFTIVGNGSYTVTPSRTGYNFSPVNSSVTVNGADVTGQDFTGTTYSISGKVTAAGAPLAGVAMSLSGTTSKVTTTNASGDYTFTIVGNGSYTVTPSRTGYNFSPVNLSVIVSGAVVTGQDFAGN